jgi:tetratricopeptide (TPR) repeat protein
MESQYMHQTRQRWNRKGALLALGLAVLLAEAHSPARPGGAGQDEPILEAARQGMRLLMDGDPDSAISVFRRIQAQSPDSPVGYLLEADATWWKIYLTTGDLVDPDVFDVARSSTTPYDAPMERLVNEAIRRAEAGIRARQNLARNYLYLGLAYGLQARLEGLRDHDLPTARAGKKMRAALLTALQLDRTLTDAYLGVGIYNYFVDTLPTIVKMLKFFIALPGGSRELGLQQLTICAQRGDLARDEARFYLAKDFSRANERQYEKSLALFQQLEHDYPHNPLWTLVAGSLEIRLGRQERGAQLYQQAWEKARHMNSEVGLALQAQVKQALDRLPRKEREAGVQAAEPAAAWRCFGYPELLLVHP